jgi:hypothetical protein
MYRVTRIVKTYACKNAISSSRNMIAVTIAHGKKDRMIIIDPVLSSVQEKPIRIFNKAWPESILAKRRMLRLNTRAIYETASIKIKNGAIISGAPEGRNKSLTCHWCFTTAR